MFCQYCGDILPQNTEQFCGDCEQHHIPKRDEALSRINQHIPIQDHIFSFGIHVSYLYTLITPPVKSQSERRAIKQQKDNKLDEILKLVTALRNSNSGAVLVHLVGLDPSESNLGPFDNFVDDNLDNIIHDGKQFSDVYKKQRLNAHDLFGEFYDFILLYVVGEPYLTTYKFNTKISLDFSLKDASELNVRKLLLERRQLNDSFHVLEGVTLANDLLKSTEHRSLQFKSNFITEENGSDFAIVNSLLDELKLKRYVSAFSKNTHGGSFVLGLTEEKVHKAFYKTKVHTLQLLKRSQFERLKPMIEKQTYESVLVCDYDGQSLELDNIVDVRFIPDRDYQEPSEDDLGVLQISVRPVSGIVFSNKEGPLAFKYDEETSEIRQLCLEEWLHLFMGCNMEIA